MRGQGPIRIQQELAQRGVDDEVIEQQLSGLSVNWLELARAVREKKYGGELPGDFQSKAKQSRFLYSRGFSSEQINRVLRTSEE